VPELVTYRMWDSTQSRMAAVDRGFIERMAALCLTAGRREILDWTVIETRHAVIRFNVPHPIATSRKLRDFLPT
jgi:hypothetical protein